MEKLLILFLLNIFMLYSAVSVCFWYFLYQSIENLEFILKSNFKDAKTRTDIRNELIQISKDKSKAYLWPKFVYEIFMYEYKLSKQKNETETNDKQE